MIKRKQSSNVDYKNIAVKHNDQTFSVVNSLIEHFKDKVFCLNTFILLSSWAAIL
jgi:hypothetical protein